METRGRGRDAAAAGQENRPPPTSFRRPYPSSSNSSPQPPSTRSRTRLRAAAACTQASSGPSHPTGASSSANPLSPHPSPSSAAQLTSRSKRQHKFCRRPTASSTPASVPVSNPLSTPRQFASAASTALRTGDNLPRSLKRSRSTRKTLPEVGEDQQPVSGLSRRQRFQPTSAAPNPPSASAFSLAVNSRPAKRARKSSTSGRPSRECAQFPTGGASGRSSTSHPNSGDMDPGDSLSGSSDRTLDRRESQREDGGVNSMGSHRTGANTLQGLLRRLGADLNDIFPRNIGTSHSRLQQLRTVISAPDSDEHQLQALSELCEFLSVGTEESLISFSVNLFVSLLVDILRTGNNIEVKILAARALTHMMEALSSSSSSIANHGAAGPLCQNLLSIEYIDLAEQSLYALRKLSVDYPHQIVTANGFQAVLSFIDFFPIGVQRVAAETASNLCRLPRPDAMDMVCEVLPIMMRLLDSEDQRIRESMVLGFRRLAESLQNAPAKLEVMCGEQGALIHKVLGLVLPSSAPSLGAPSCSSAFQLLAIIARGNATLGLRILSTQALILKLKSQLSSIAMPHAVDCLVLADSLLPDIPEVEGTPMPLRSRRRHNNIRSTTAFTALDEKRRCDLKKNSSPLLFFGRSLFPVLMKYYSSSADIMARRGVLAIISKFIDISTEAVLLEVLQSRLRDGIYETHDWSGIQFCPFVATLLRVNSSRSETLVGLAIVGSVLQKLPSLREAFIREGIVHEVIRISAYEMGNDVDEEKKAGNGSYLHDHRMPNSRLLANSSALSRTDCSMPMESFRSMGSIWSVVAAFQRTSEPTGRRGELISLQERFTTRSFDFRLNDSQKTEILHKIARSILTNHLGAGADGTLDQSVLRNTRLGKLTDICDILMNSSNLSSQSDAACTQALSSLMDLLTSPKNLSVFEVSKSGVIGALSQYLSPSDTGLRSKRMSSLIVALNQENGKGAFASLVYLSLGVLSSEEKLSTQGNETSCSTIHGAVSTGLRQLTQPFRLRLRKSSRDNGTALRDYSHHIVLIEPLATMSSVQEFLWPKVAGPERNTGVHARPRPSKGAGTRSPSAQGLSDSGEINTGEEGSGKANTDPPPGEVEGERGDGEVFDIDEAPDNGDALVHMDDEEGNSDPSDEEISSGEEDVIGQEFGHGDDQERNSADFDVDQLATSLPPLELDHEVLGQAPLRMARSTDGSDHGRATRAGPASRQTSEPVRNFRSYAAALAANVSTPMNRIPVPGGSSRGGPQRHNPRQHHEWHCATVAAPVRLTFTLNGKVVPPDCSILSAVIQSSKEGRGIGQHLWSDIHTLVYATADSQQDAPVSGRVAENQDPGSVAGKARANWGRDVPGRLRRSRRLLEHREKVKAGVVSKSILVQPEASAEKLNHVVMSDRSPQVPLLLDMSDFPAPIASIVELLRQLHWIYAHMSERLVRSELKIGTNWCLREDVEVQFHSNELCAKLINQLSNPLVLCGNAVPNWCFSLSRNASFLIPFQTRRVFFQSTSLGLARALHLLQARLEAPGTGSTAEGGSQGSGDNDTRIGRIQRQKVRIHRSRILESAIKVMNLYATHSTVLEVQFFHEVGTGIGPTLEFYTLASRELQKVDLGLWRSNAPSHAKQGSSQTNRTSLEQTVKYQMGGTEFGQVGTGVKRRRRRHSRTIAMPRATATLSAVDEEVTYVSPTGSGLFPSCLAKSFDDFETEASEKSSALFAFVGRLVGKAIVDGRLLDLRFSKTMAKLILAYCRVFDERWRVSQRSRRSSIISDGLTSRKVLMEELGDAARARVWEVYTCGDSVMKLLEDVDTQLASSLRVILDMVRDGRKDSVSALCLTFVLPGDDEHELIENGAEIEVTGNNAEEYVRRVLYYVLFEGVQQQVEALLRGMNDVLDIRGLLAFEREEMEMLICGPSFEKWSVDFLVRATRCDHGYSHESHAVMNFLQVLSELNQGDQQRFVLFATGAPALPVGGLLNLHPPLTIVRRTPEPGRSPDESLPTVMTCTNYFKLPDYSSLEITRRQVVFAIMEGQGAFHLS